MATRINKAMVKDSETRLNEALRKRNLDYRYRVVQDGAWLTIVRESPTHVHLDKDLYKDLGTKEAYQILTGMIQVITDNVLA